MRCLRVAVEMKENEYAKKANLAKEGLFDYVKPLKEYSESYQQLLQQNIYK
jgi:hypothetical protein